MDFASVILFLVLYYIRPQEWIGWITALKPVTLTVALAIISMFTRHRGLTLRDFFKTPHDWMMLAFFVWIVASAPSPREALSSSYNVFVFYAVTIQALSTMKRIQTFLNWWTLMILIVAALAIASEFGFDPMGGNDIAQFRMKGRLILNTSIFNNPNALGHSVVPVIFMIYFTLIWRRPIFVKIGAIPVIMLPLYCVYLTVSKGAFLSGFGTGVIAMTLGRPRVVQLLVLALSLTVGWTAMQALPRMSEIDKAQRDQAIQGRVTAFKWGLNNMQTHIRGIGLGHFNEAFLRAHRYSKASHSSFVQIGCELGYPGMFLFMAIVYFSLKTLIFARTEDPEEERVRRILFVLILAYLISSWMVDFGFRATFFLFVAAIAAFHRLLAPDLSDEPKAVPESARPAFALPALAGASSTAIITSADPGFNRAAGALSSSPVSQAPSPNPLAGALSSRMHWSDFVFITLMTVATVWFWRHAISIM